METESKPDAHITEGAPITQEGLAHAKSCAACWMAYYETIQRHHLIQTVSSWDLEGLLK